MRNMKTNPKAHEIAYEAVKEKLEKGDSAFLGNASRTLMQSATPFFKAKGGVFIQKGERTEAAYYIITGKLYVQADFLDGTIYQFSYLGKGTIISDVDVLSGTYVNAATLIAAQDVMALKLPLDLFVKELKTNIDFLWYVTTGMARKLYVSSYERGVNLFKEGVDKVLLYLIRGYELDEDERETVRIEKTRDMICSEIGISIRTLNRSIDKLKKAKLITVEKGKIVITEEQFRQLLNTANEKSLY